MKPSPLAFLAGALSALALGTGQLPADTLKFSGVLGNSGEQGRWLVHFGNPPAHGLGVVYDQFGTLWDRGGTGVLNRYALDGRQLATYPIPKGDTAGDRIVLVGDKLILLLGGHLYSLPVSSPAGTKPDDLKVAADRMSFGTAGGKIAIRQDMKYLLLDPATVSTDTLVDDASTLERHDFELLPDGGLVIASQGKLHLYQNGKEITDGWPRPTPGENLQFLDNFWFGTMWHGTIRRFNAALEADPGVVLGGGSGSFIGHVDGNSELEMSFGLAKIGSGSFADSGIFGIVHLLHWNEDAQQFAIVRRIGAISGCQGLAINRQGDIWYNSGKWLWDDRPDSPQHDDTVRIEIGQAVMLPNDSFVAGCSRGNNVVTGNFSWNAQYTEFKDIPDGYLTGAAVYHETTDPKISVLLRIGKTGKGLAFRIDSAGHCQKELGPVALASALPVSEWTSLAMKDGNTLLGGADGYVIEMQRDGNNWKEAKRWKSWGPGAQDAFGSRIYITTDAGRLWVSDTSRDRVLCLSADTGKPVAVYGVIDQSGDDLSHLSAPAVIAARDHRAVVFDGGNQRLVKLSLEQ